MAEVGLREAVEALKTEPRQVTAIARLTGPPGREDEAAEAWASELTYYFTRGCGEAPQVSYAGGIYTVTGLIQTTHPHDGPVTDFTRAEPWPLDFVTGAERRQRLRALYKQRGIWFDGRDHG